MPHTLPLRWPEQTPEEERQERNLYYVAMTRSTQVLIFLESEESIAAGDAKQRADRYGSTIPYTTS